MTFDDFMDWRAYEQVEPFGDRRADYQAASICAAVFNAALMRAGSRKRMRVETFLLEFKDAITKVPEVDKKAHSMNMKMVARMHYAISKAQDKPRQRPTKEKKPRRK